MKEKPVCRIPAGTVLTDADLPMLRALSFWRDRNPEATDIVHDPRSRSASALIETTSPSITFTAGITPPPATGEAG